MAGKCEFNLCCVLITLELGEQASLVATRGGFGDAYGRLHRFARGMAAEAEPQGAK